MVLIQIYFVVYFFWCVSADILKIYHLCQFTSLTKLQLDNNVIEKIEGLENLTNLLWLGEFILRLSYQNQNNSYN